MQQTSRCFAEIRTDNIINNLNCIRGIVGNTKIMCVVKADAYGHGAAVISKILEENGADYFGVATVLEAVNLRKSGIGLPILLFGYFEFDDISVLIEHDITISIYSLEILEHINNLKLSRKICVHIKIDTGMSRLGFRASDAEGLFSAISPILGSNNIFVEGIYTHFANSDDIDEGFLCRQFELFNDLCRIIEYNGINIPLRHCANSGAILKHRHTFMDMVRPGIVLYGYPPSSNIENEFGLLPCMTLKSRIVQIKDIGAGEEVGYGLTYICNNNTKIAVISIGYADGLSRDSGMSVYVNDVRVPIVGIICMDMCMVDISILKDVMVGDTVVIFGYIDNNSYFGADEVAKNLNTIPHDIICSVTSRVYKIYI